MGGLYKITFEGTDKTFGTSDDLNFTLYLTTSAYDWYIHNTNKKLLLLQSVPDEVINIFNAQNAITVKEGATYQELLSYFEYLGMPHDQAVAKAQSSIGITRDQMIKSLDQIQSNIIATKSAQLVQYEQAIKTATTTDSNLNLNKELQLISETVMPTSIGTVTVKTLGDISKEILNLSSTIKSSSTLSNLYDFTTATIDPINQTVKSVTSPNEDINKDPSKQPTLPTTTKQISEYIQDVNDFGKKYRTPLLIIIGIGIVSIIGLNIIRNKKEGVNV